MDTQHLHIGVVLTPDGRLRFSGQHFLPDGEYEYEITVPADQIHLVAQALHVDTDHVVDAIVDHADHIVTTGEYTWLTSHGVKPELWSRRD